MSASAPRLPMSRRHFTIDARTVLALGRESIRDETTAVLELVKNSYDADARNVRVTLGATPEPYIRVTDDGSGMTSAEVDQHWLRIGYSHKRAGPAGKGRTRVGEKGIGRLSADRLGAVLELFTRSRSDEAATVGIRINWDSFDSPGTELSEVPITDLTSGPLTDPSEIAFASSERYGTQLTMLQLRRTWDRAAVELLREELANLTPPLDPPDNFRVLLESELAPDLNGHIGRAVPPPAFIELRATLVIDEAPRVEYALRDRSAEPERNQSELREPGAPASLPWAQFTGRPESADELALARTMGPLTAHLLFYPRTSETIAGTTLDLAALREFLDDHAGVSIYRDRIRVRPYGAPGTPFGDWLGLGIRKTKNPAGRGRSSFRLAPNQLVGAVYIARQNNPHLSDASSREGLVENTALAGLRAFMLGAITQLEAHYHSIPQSAPPAQQDPSEARHRAEQLDQQLAEVGQSLQDVAKEKSKRGRAAKLKRTMATLRSVRESAKVASSAIKELADQTTTYRGLATIGIAATVFAHETQSSLTGIVASSRVAHSLLGRPAVDSEAIAREITKVVNYATQLAAWGRFALTRIRRDNRRRRQYDVAAATATLLRDLKPMFSASAIELELRASTSLVASLIPMDFDALLVNLLTNAYSASQYVAKGTRRVRVTLQPAARVARQGLELIVEDSGPGVAKEHAAKIWAPLFTTKIGGEAGPGGTGLGLSIVASIVREHDGSRTVDTSDELGGARFSIWLPTGPT